VHERPQPSRRATHVPIITKENTRLAIGVTRQPEAIPTHRVLRDSFPEIRESFRGKTLRCGVVLSRILAFRLLAAFSAGHSETTFCHLTRECGKRPNPFRFKLLRSRYLFFGVPPQSFALFLPITKRAAHVVNHNFVRSETAREHSILELKGHLSVRLGWRYVTIRSEATPMRIAPMLDSNAVRVKNLTGMEIWLFIIARVLAGFGLGVLGVRYFPQIVGPLGFPTLVVGLILFAIAAKGLRRTKS
jgi:hypothetical protein